MRIGVVGVGRIGAHHARALRPAVTELVIADTDAERARHLASEIGARAVDDVDALFSEELDGVVIAAPTAAHPDLICRAVDAGFAVFCEKPAAPTLAETRDLIAKVGDRAERVQIGFHRRFDPGYRAARRLVRDGALGWIHTMRATTCDATPPPAEFIAGSGGIFRDCSVHDFDIIRWLTGRDIAEVFAVGSNRGAGFFAAAGDVSTGLAVVRLDDGTLGTVTASRYNGSGYDVRLEILGSEQSVAVGLDDHAPLRSVEPGVDWPRATPHRDFMSRFAAAYREELLAFLDVAAGRQASPCTLDDALAAFVVAEACEVSRSEHRPVQITELQ